jgi:hypothetical protein
MDIWKKGKLNCEKDMENTEKSRLNSEMIWNIWTKCKLKCEDMENAEEK